MIPSAVPTTIFVVRFGSWAEPDSYGSAEDEFNDGRVELFQQLLWQVEFSQLANKYNLCWAFFDNRFYVNVPLQVLRDGAAQESEWLHCYYSAVHDGEWGVSPEVHDHLHCF